MQQNSKLSKFLRQSLISFFSDKAWWFLSVRVFKLLSLSLLFFHNVLAAVSSGLPQVSPVYPYLPTPPLGQDMTWSQFLSKV